MKIIEVNKFLSTNINIKIFSVENIKNNNDYNIKLEFIIMESDILKTFTIIADVDLGALFNHVLTLARFHCVDLMT